MPKILRKKALGANISVDKNKRKLGRLFGTSYLKIININSEKVSAV